MREIKTAGFTYHQEEGLNEEQVRELRQKYGSNLLSPPKKQAWWKKLLAHFDDPTIKILLAAAFLSLLVTTIERFLIKNAEANYYDTLGIFIAVALATLVGYFSELKSDHEFDLLNKIKEDIRIKTFRNGQLTQVEIDRLVVGDVVQVEPGDIIPADGMIIKEAGLLLNQSMLTGESIPVEKPAYRNELDLEALRGSVLVSDPSFAARGSMVSDGNGVLLVTEVGDRTQIGKIAGVLADGGNSENETPLVQKLTRLVRRITVAGTAAALTIFSIMTAAVIFQSPLLQVLLQNRFDFIMLIAVSLLGGGISEKFVLRPFFKTLELNLNTRWAAFLASVPMSLAVLVIGIFLYGAAMGTPESIRSGIGLLREGLLAFVVAVTVIVVAVPEGLPMMVTMSLSLNMMKMIKENCLVRRLIASETIGSATVICTDKTGTLTENKMRAVSVWLEGKLVTQDQFDELSAFSVWNRLTAGISINSNAHLECKKETESDNEEVKGIGNPTEVALLKMLRFFNIDFNGMREQCRKIYELGHNSERKMSLVITESEGKQVCYLKGAPERVLDCCSSVFCGGTRVPMADYREMIENALKTASDGELRVIAFCEKELGGRFDPDRFDLSADELPVADSTFIGFVGITDPVRSEVPAAVEQCRKAHIQVKMITGDALPTALAVAKEAGIYSGKSDELAITSDEFAKIADSELPEAAEKICVLARSTPMDKVRLVKALHKKGEVVAMTGDGTNDAPALKIADVGLAMGMGGTEVAKEASDIVLIDDNFKSIVTGVWWGRTLFQNIQRFIQFQLSVNVVAILCAVIGPILGVPLPFTVAQLLWINIIMDTFAALALSTEPPRPQTLMERPIQRNASILTKTMGITVLVVSFYQTGILFACLFFGWFLDPAYRYNAAISYTDPEYLDHNLKALTVFFTVFVMFQFWHKFNARALTYRDSVFKFLTKNPTFIVIVAVITLVQILLVQNQAAGSIFRTEPLSLCQWAGIFVLTATVVPVAKFGRFIASRIAGEE